MKKDVNLLLSSTLKTYGIILIGIFILKICGLDYFGLDTDNEIIIMIDKFIRNLHLQFVWYTFTLYIYTVIVLGITCIDNSNKLYKYTFCITPICFLIQILKNTIKYTSFFVITDLLCLFVFSICYIVFVQKKKVCKDNIINYWIFMLLNLIFQLISVTIRDINPNIDFNNFAMSFIANIDYIILSIISYKLFFIKGGTSLWVGVVGLFSHLLTLLKTLQTKLLKVYLNNKVKSRFEKISDLIYVPLFLLWNFFTLGIILFIATLNHTFVDCCIILCSFWINKRTFGKEFHMKTALSCFIVSNLTYYCLNRITFPNGISLLVSILLGITLCYVTSKFVKEKKLYRGMSLESYDNCISNIIEKDSIDYTIGKLYYVDMQTELWIGNKVGYSRRGIQERKNKLKKMLER